MTQPTFNSYWNNRGLHPDLYNSLREKLIPPVGPCNTFEGEYLRAISAIYYEGYNNGFCNNLSGPYNFLVRVFGLENLPEEFELVLEPLVNKGYSNKLDMKTKICLEASVNEIIQYIDEKDGHYTETPIGFDMYSYVNPTKYEEGDEYE